MAKIQTHTPAAAAQSLLDLLVDMHIRPGDAVDWNRVEKMWTAGGASSPADLKAAKDFATANGSLEASGGQLVLTEQGTKTGGGLSANAVRWAEDIIEILAAFFHERGGDSFTVEELRGRWQLNREHRPDDLAAGLQYGVQQGWFTKVDDGNYTLTAKGRAQV